MTVATQKYASSELRPAAVCRSLHHLPQGLLLGHFIQSFHLAAILLLSVLSGLLSRRFSSTRTSRFASARTWRRRSISVCTVWRRRAICSAAIATRSC